MVRGERDGVGMVARPRLRFRCAGRGIERIEGRACRVEGIERAVGRIGRQSSDPGVGVRGLLADIRWVAPDQIGDRQRLPADHIAAARIEPEPPEQPAPSAGDEQLLAVRAEGHSLPGLVQRHTRLQLLVEGVNRQHAARRIAAGRHQQIVFIRGPGHRQRHIAGRDLPPGRMQHPSVRQQHAVRCRCAADRCALWPSPPSPASARHRGPSPREQPQPAQTLIFHFIRCPSPYKTLLYAGGSGMFRFLILIVPTFGGKCHSSEGVSDAKGATKSGYVKRRLSVG